MTNDELAPSKWAIRLGHGGLVPFVGLAVAVWLARPGEAPWASVALLGYGAVIASFLGAIHWGLAMRDRFDQPLSHLLWGVTPGLAGWAATSFGGAPGLALMATLLGVCYAVDRALYPRYQLQAWLPMRRRLTLVAGISCLAAALALVR